MEQTPHAVAPDLGGTDDLVQGESGIVKTTALPRPFAPQLRAVITNASSSTAASTTAVTVSTWSIGSPPWQATLPERYRQNPAAGDGSRGA